MIVKDRLLIDSFVETLLINYRNNRSFLGVETNLKIDLADFIVENTKEEVEYAFSLIENSEIADILAPLILEYRTYGLEHFIIIEDEVLNSPPKTWFEKVKDKLKEFTCIKR